MRKLAQNEVIEEHEQDHRYGMPIYQENPSVGGSDKVSKRKKVQVGSDKRGIIFDDGDKIAIGGAAFYEFEEVDDERFVKMYLSGIKQAAGLSKAGLTVFEMVYQNVQNTPNDDKVMLSPKNSTLTLKTYHRGLRELLEKEFLYLTLYPGVFFVNIRYMFNGDRLAFVRGYKRKSKRKIDPKQNDLFIEVADE